MKIQTIATVSPSSEKIHVIKKLIKARMNIARINLKHASIQESENLTGILSKNAK